MFCYEYLTYRADLPDSTVTLPHPAKNSDITEIISPLHHQYKTIYLFNKNMPMALVLTWISNYLALYTYLLLDL